VGSRTLVLQVVAQISGHKLLYPDLPFQQQVMQYDHVPFVRHSFHVLALQSVPDPAVVICYLATNAHCCC
jgi:hypothetical protein